MSWTRNQIMAAVGIIAALIVTLTLIVERMGVGEFLGMSDTTTLRAAAKLSKPEGEVRELERRYESRRVRSLKEAESLVRNMETQAEDQRARLQEIENDLRKARDLLDRLNQEPVIDLPDSGTP